MENNYEAQENKCTHNTECNEGSFFLADYKHTLFWVNTKERWPHCCLSEKWWQAGNWKHTRFADVFVGPNIQLQTNTPRPLVDYRFTGLWTLPTGLEIAANCSFQLALCFEFPKILRSFYSAFLEGCIRIFMCKDFHFSSQLPNKSPWAGALGVT